MDDRRVGLILRALRRRRGWRQSDVAARAGVGQTTVSRLERGHLADMTLGSIRAVCRVLDASFLGDLRWRGAAVDRLLDEGHAALVEEVVSRFVETGWRAIPEVSFYRSGERGSIDVLAGFEQTRTAAIVEVKKVFGSFEELLRRHDGKTRVAPHLVEERFGWRPKHVGRILVVADTTTNRRLLARYEASVRSVLPARTVAIRKWLVEPDEAVSGVWFLPLSLATNGTRRTMRPDRVRVAADASAGAR